MDTQDNVAARGDRPVHLLLNNIGGGYALQSARTLASLLADQIG
jgi:hypothetical protein